MKKQLIVIIILILSFLITSCGNSLPNNLEPLKAYENCEIKTLSEDYVCVWADEFNGSELDMTKWNIEVNGYGGGNQELQYYKEDNIFVRDGKLEIEGRKEYFSGKSYTSGRINSKYKGDFRYGRVEFSAKVPTGNGTWSAVWLLPTMNSYGGWPNSGEIDILEHVGYDPNRVFSSTHTKKFNHLGDKGSLTFSKTLYEATTDFNNYVFEWEPGNMKMYVNESKIGEFNYVPAYNQDVEYKDVYPFDQMFHIIINLAIGGVWGGVQGINDEIFPTSMYVDYVRVYQKNIANIDKTAPSKPEKIRKMTSLSRSIFWNPSEDDVMVEKYAVYVDGDFYRYTNLNQIRFNSLFPGEYEITIEAIDFTGRVSSKSDKFILLI